MRERDCFISHLINNQSATPLISSPLLSLELEEERAEISPGIVMR